MYMGFNLSAVDKTTKAADIVFEVEKDKPQLSLTYVLDQEIDLYRSALINTRCNRNLNDFDCGRRVDKPEGMKDLLITFFKAKNVITDNTGLLEIADVAYPCVKINAWSKEYSGRITSGYRDIDTFINTYSIIDIPNMAVYMPYNSIFNSDIENEIVRFVITNIGSVPGCFIDMNEKTIYYHKEIFTFTDIESDIDTLIRMAIECMICIQLANPIIIIEDSSDDNILNIITSIDMGDINAKIGVIHGIIK